jgi:ATP-binding cassette, subfamily G (WHITE), member 2, SNQ2
MMEMTHLGDALIGDLESGVGISVEERKRLTIGLELVGKPKILFLDGTSPLSPIPTFSHFHIVLILLFHLEPTSGLDAQSSYNIVKFIRKLADSGMPLVCTIHQPSSILFEYFDRLLLLARGGKTVYFGDIGENSQTLLGYFERYFKYIYYIILDLNVIFFIFNSPFLSFQKSKTNKQKEWSRKM